VIENGADISDVNYPHLPPPDKEGRYKCPVHGWESGALCPILKDPDKYREMNYANHVIDVSEDLDDDDC